MQNRIICISTPYEIEHIGYRKKKVAVDRFLATAQCEVEVASPLAFLPLIEYPGRGERDGISRTLTAAYEELDSSQSSKAIVRDGAVYYPFNLDADSVIEWHSATFEKSELLKADLAGVEADPYQPSMSRMVFRDGMDDAIGDLHRMAEDMVFVGETLFVKRNPPCAIFNPGKRQTGGGVWIYDYTHAVDPRRANGSFVAALPIADLERLMKETVSPDVNVRCNMPWTQRDHVEATKLTLHEIVHAARNEFENYIAAVKSSSAHWRIDADDRSNYASLATISAIRSRIGTVPEAIRALAEADREFRNEEWSCISSHWRALIPASLAECAQALGRHVDARQVGVIPAMTITCRSDRIDREGEEIPVTFLAAEGGIFARREFSRLNDDNPWWFTFGSDHLLVSEEAAGTYDEDGGPIYLVEDPFVTFFGAHVEFTTANLENPIKPRAPALALAYCADIFAEEAADAARMTSFTADVPYSELPAALKARSIGHLTLCMIEAATIAATDSSDKSMRFHPALAETHRAKRVIQQDPSAAEDPKMMEDLVGALASLERDLPKVENAMDICRLYRRMGERMIALENDLTIDLSFEAAAPGL